ncbi:hypothetical protein C2G38_2174779 [Gigaspora rosea]|uniref:Uncharacterized protein n=1 Tax=Gigaspora rosea TaxID=44941 RepID=A0A397VM65_9GLOM|nr:hypothetical protein C2G38_2174779 [Gigaspora rosea]
MPIFPGKCYLILGKCYIMIEKYKVSIDLNKSLEIKQNNEFALKQRGEIYCTLRSIINQLYTFMNRL